MGSSGTSLTYGWKVGSRPWRRRKDSRRKRVSESELRRWIEEQRRFNNRVVLAIVLVAIISMIPMLNSIPNSLPPAIGAGVTISTVTMTVPLTTTQTQVTTLTYTSVKPITTTMTRTLTLTTYTTSHIAHTYLKHDWIGHTPLLMALTAWALYGDRIASEYGLDRAQFFDRVRNDWQFLMEINSKFRSGGFNDISAPYGALVRSGIALAPSDMYYSLIDEMYPEYLVKRAIRGIYIASGSGCLDFYEQSQWNPIAYGDNKWHLNVESIEEITDENPYSRLIDPAIYGKNPIVILLREPGWTIEPGSGRIVFGPHGTYPPKDQLKEWGLPLSEIRGSRTFYLIIPRKYLAEIGIPEGLLEKDGRIYKDLAIARQVGYENVATKEEMERYWAFTKRAIEVLRKHEAEVGYPIGNWVLAPLDHWLPKEVCNVLPPPSPIFFKDEAELARAMAAWYKLFGQYVADYRWERDRWFMEKWGVPGEVIAQIEATRASPNVWYYLNPGGTISKVVLQVPPGLEGR